MTSSSLASLTNNPKANILNICIVCISTLMLVYAHLGVSGRIISNLPSVKATCLFFSSDPQCHKLDDVYDIQFVDAVKKGWEGDAKVMALLLCIASGIWPYCKNFLLLVVWFKPMSVSKRKRMLSWIRHLGRWSFVDVYIMLLLTATFDFQKNILSSLEVVIRAVPANAVFAYCVAATIALIQAEVISITNTRALNTKVDPRMSDDTKDGIVAPRWMGVVVEFISFGVLPVLFIILGCLTATFGLFTYTLTGIAAALPGQNTYPYSLLSILHKLFQPEESANLRDKLLVVFMSIMTLVIPIGISIALVLVTVMSILRIPIPKCGSLRMYEVIQIFYSFACVDVFVVSYIVVTMEIEKLFGAVGAAITHQYDSTSSRFTITMTCTEDPGFYISIMLVVLFWYIQLMFDIRHRETSSNNAVPPDAADEEETGRMLELPRGSGSHVS